MKAIVHVALGLIALVGIPLAVVSPFAYAMVVLAVACVGGLVR